MKTKDQPATTGTYLTYIIGFLLSIALTVSAFLLVNRHLNTHHLTPSDNFMLIALSLLAITQLGVQMIFFLHLDHESKPWWNLQALIFALGTVFILVGGSIWIMTNLNYHHAAHNVTHTGRVLKTPQQTTQYIIQDEGIHQ